MNLIFWLKSNMLQSKVQFFTLVDSYNGVVIHFFLFTTEKRIQDSPMNGIAGFTTDCLNITGNMADDSLLTRILQSVFFRNAKGKAGKYAGNTTRLIELAKEVVNKLQTVGVKGNLAEFQSGVQLLIRMVRAYASGEYRAISWKSMVSIVAVLIYFVSPIDLIPDFLPVIGITDDVALVIWLIKTLGDEIQKFGDWEKQEKTINIG